MKSNLMEMDFNLDVELFKHIFNIFNILSELFAYLSIFSIFDSIVEQRFFTQNVEIYFRECWPEFW